MGQQQLLLLVLGIIIVGIAVAVGIGMFSSSRTDANRDAVTSDLANLASKAQQYYQKPASMAGGAGDFLGFTLGALDQSNANGAYRLAVTTAPTTTVAAPPAGITTISDTQPTSIFIVGYGTAMGRDQTKLVQVYTTVTATSITSLTVN